MAKSSDRELSAQTVRVGRSAVRLSSSQFYPGHNFLQVHCTESLATRNKIFEIRIVEI